ncbi:MAG: hypothetical protein JSS68_03890 [Actinobacteria bacterium]|nr:hypothetical protein [Actinomycetota bacterium]MBS1884723.1 hypothetical protein [Actinomycetota bacterium]
MYRYRGQILAMICCLAVEAGIFYGLVGLGAGEDLVLYAEVIWLCATVVITLSVGERFERKWRDRGD